MKAANRIQHVEEYYFSKKLKEVQRLKDKGAPILNFGIGNPDQPPPEEALNKLRQASLYGQANGYQGYKGTDGLRESMQKWMWRFYEVSLLANSEILPLMGSKEGIMQISQAFINPEDEVLIPNPGYPTYGSVASMMGAKTVSYTITPDDGIQYEALENLVTDKTKILWLNMPHMPTGEKPNREVLQKLIDLALERNFLIVNDNPYSTILTEDYFSIFQLVGAKKVCLELNSLSKSYNMAGWRIGWVSGREELIDTVLKVKSNMDSGMYWPIQQGAKQALRLSNQWFRELNDVYRSRREVLWELLDKIGCSYSKQSVGMFVWAKIPSEYKNGEELSDQLLHDHGIFMTPGRVFGTNGERYIRASLCASEQELKIALNRIVYHLKLKENDNKQLVHNT